MLASCNGQFDIRDSFEGASWDDAEAFHLQEGICRKDVARGVRVPIRYAAAWGRQGMGRAVNIRERGFMCFSSFRSLEMKEIFGVRLL